MRFNAAFNFSSAKKQNEGEDLYLSKVLDFIKMYSISTMVMPEVAQHNSDASEASAFENELVTVLAYLIYPKETNLERSLALGDKVVLKEIRDLLYNFSVTQIRIVTQRFRSFSLLFNYFSKNEKQRLLNSDKTMLKKIDEYKEGFAYLEELIQ